VTGDAKTERQRALLASLHPPATDDATTARDRLEQMLSGEELQQLDQRVLDAVAAAREPEPDPPAFFDAVGAARAAKKQTLIDAVRGRQPAPDPQPLRPSSFDGGVRAERRKPPSHDEWLVAMIRSKAADVGAEF
jgi:hypothetical protein